jgi:RNA polymerase subunit RPABC4/transcription elongation factor Spt4
MRQAPGESVQKVCPRCSTLAYTGDRRCPWCGASYRRRAWPRLLALALVQSAVVLAGVAYMLTVAGDGLDRRVDTVQRDLDRSFDDVQRSVREELDRRLPESTP